jgi:chemotaxis methyl-accepting protein methylase
MDEFSFEFRIQMTDGSTHSIHVTALDIDDAWFQLTRTGEYARVRGIELVHVPEGAQ